MPPIGSPLTPLVVFSLAILTPDIYCVSVLSQIAPWSSAQTLAKGGASAASRPIPVLWEQPKTLAEEISCNTPASLTYWIESP